MGEAKRRSLLNSSSIPAEAKSAPVAGVQMGTVDRKKVAVVVPSFSEVKADFALALAGLTSHTVFHPVSLAIINEKSSMVVKARNSLVQKALDLGADHIFFIDADLTFPADALVRLIGHNLDVCGSTYNKRVPPFETLGHFIGLPKDLSQGGLVEADFMPGGMMLIRKEVYQSIPWPWYGELYRRPYQPMDAFIHMLNDYSPLDMPKELEEQIKNDLAIQKWISASTAADIGETGKIGYISEDYFFSRKVRKHGYRIYCDLDISYQMGHCGERVVTLERPRPIQPAAVDAINRVGAAAAMIDLSKPVG